MKSERDLAAWLRARPLLVDVVIALVVTGLSVALLFAEYDYVEVDPRDADALGVALTLSANLPLVWRRLAPVAVFVATLPASVALGLLSYSGTTGISVLLALYAVSAYRGSGTALLALGVSKVLVVVILALDDYPTTLADAFTTLATFLASWALGRALRNRRAYTSELEARAAQLQATRDADTRAALAEERGRIARELHDVVAHHVSVMTVQAAAARRTVDRDPQRAREAMEAVETIGRAALVEMRRVVGVLRDGAVHPCDVLVPQPGVRELPALLDALEEAGLRVLLEVDGAPRRLDDSVDLAVYRVVQEALTNTLKHAGPATGRVCLRYRPDSVEVVVSDDGRGAAAWLPGEGEGRAGHGLVGMRERISLYGGEFSAGPQPGGGYLVRVRIPLERSTEVVR